MANIDLIDIGSGNIGSLLSSLSKVKAKVNLCRNISDLKNNKLILPGVGSFNVFMEKLKKNKIDRYIFNLIENKKPILGICVGYQVLFSSSEEDGYSEGLKIFKGNFKRIDNDMPIPHVGWNSCNFNKKSKLFNGIKDNTDFYFTHSYILEKFQKKNIATFTKYKTNFPSSVTHENIFGVQFHPEKSQYAGLKILENFLKI